MFKLLAILLVVIAASYATAAYATNVVNEYNHLSIDGKAKTGFYCHGDNPKTPQDNLDCFILAHSK